MLGLNVKSGFKYTEHERLGRLLGRTVEDSSALLGAQCTSPRGQTFRVLCKWEGAKRAQIRRALPFRGERTQMWRWRTQSPHREL